MATASFTSTRLFVIGLQSVLAPDGLSPILKAELTGILTEPVLRHLPPSLQMGRQGGDVAPWIKAVSATAEILLVRRRDTDRLIGLLLVAEGHGRDGPRTLHIGYLLSEASWGQGFATELVSGFVAAQHGTGPVQLIGGVGKDNPASGRVLEKSGFVASADLSTPGVDMFVLHLT